MTQWEAWLGRYGFQVFWWFSTFSGGGGEVNPIALGWQCDLDPRLITWLTIFFHAYISIMLSLKGTAVSWKINPSLVAAVAVVAVAGSVTGPKTTSPVVTQGDLIRSKSLYFTYHEYQFYFVIKKQSSSLMVCTCSHISLYLYQLPGMFHNEDVYHYTLR